MSLGHLLLRGFSTAKVGMPIPLLALAGTVWWGLRANELAEQLEHHRPAQMSLAEAVRASRDGEVHVRFWDALLDVAQPNRRNQAKPVATMLGRG